MSAGKATLYELQTVYGVRDMLDMVEVLVIDAYNQRVLADRARRG